MNRRGFLGTALGAGAALMTPSLTTGNARAAGKYHLRYAPRLDFLKDELSIPARLELFAEHGFDATEYNGLMTHSLGEVEGIRKKLDSLGMGMGIFVGNPSGWKTAGMVDPTQHEAFLAEVKQAVEYHKVIGNRCSTVITGPEMVGKPRGVQRRNVVDALRKAAAILEPTQLTIVVEPLNPIDHAGYFLETSDEAAEIMATVGSSHVKILFDIYHQQVTEGNLIQNIRTHWDHVGYFQVGDVPGRKEPGTGEINYRNVFKTIFDKGYKGMIGMEHGLSQPGRAGLLKCFAEYKAADAW